MSPTYTSTILRLGAINLISVLLISTSAIAFFAWFNTGRWALCAQFLHVLKIRIRLVWEVPLTCSASTPRPHELNDALHSLSSVYHILSYMHNKFFIQTKYKGTRSHSMKLFKHQFDSELKRHAFGQWIIDNWNSLIEKIVNSESLDIFKCRLDKQWRTEWFKISTE